MQENKNESSFRFNKRRFEGKSCIDMPNKNPQHEVPKLNPTSTVSYVQLVYYGFWELGLNSGDWNGYSGHFVFSPTLR
ncbi:hypothetical protein Patl1_34081 [Pistacia atlantica]|uniref:Uncharacterized protein n=1 Tax=Pistacia atlantica TaxID=434234 RepID=A0ACC0ZW60_9ROSI|nr:hypothetical protein Patl1_34081 [Pistacia atlantica]